MRPGRMFDTSLRILGRRCNVAAGPSRSTAPEFSSRLSVHPLCGRSPYSQAPGSSRARSAHGGVNDAGDTTRSPQRPPTAPASDPTSDDPSARVSKPAVVLRLCFVRKHGCRGPGDGDHVPSVRKRSRPRARTDQAVRVFNPASAFRLAMHH